MRTKSKGRQPYHIRNYRFGLILMVTVLSVIGIFVIGSADAEYQQRQIIGLILGLIVMFVLSFLDYRWVLRFYWVLYFINIILLVAVLLFGEEANGAVRWLNLGFVQFQPSDLTKIIMIMFYAKFFMQKNHDIRNWRTLLECFALLFPSLILIYEEPNLSNVICLFLVFCTLIFLAGLSYKLIWRTLAVVIPAMVILLLIIIQPNQPLIHDYQQTRILAWLYPEEYESEEAYQQLNSVMAIGSGQLTGKGYNSDATDSVKNGNFISEPHTDFIFAIIGEELGFVGCCIVIILILLIVIDCILVGMKAKDTAGRLICGGIASLIGIQSFINISVVTMLFPNTGISLPFVSYGLTSIVCFYAGIGLVLNVGLQPANDDE